MGRPCHTREYCAMENKNVLENVSIGKSRKK
jgi:hypothetical protein